MSMNVRINLFRKKDHMRKNGRVVCIGKDLEETLRAASRKLDCQVAALCTMGGSLVDDVSVLRDWDSLIVCLKEDLNSPNGDSQSLSSSALPQSPVLREKSVESATSSPTDFVLRRTSAFPTPDAASRHDWVKLNVGGKIFATTRGTLSSDPNSMLARMFEPSDGKCWSSATDSSGAFLIDRSPEYFKPLLNFLRHGKLIINKGVNPRGVLEEARFFGLSKAIEPLETLVHNAIVQCVHMPRVNLEGASLKGCVMDNKIGVGTNMEGANLKGAMFDNSQMNGVNLRLASLKGACLRSCNLRYAVMAGTDLENSDLLGSDLQHANLRGANIEGANLQDVVI